MNFFASASPKTESAEPQNLNYENNPQQSFFRVPNGRHNRHSHSPLPRAPAGVRRACAPAAADGNPARHSPHTATHARAAAAHLELSVSILAGSFVQSQRIAKRCELEEIIRTIWIKQFVTNSICDFLTVVVIKMSRRCINDCFEQVAIVFGERLVQ